MKFGIKNGFEIMKKGVDMDHEIYSTTRMFSRMSRDVYKRQVYGDENEIVQSLRQEFEKDGIRVFPISAVSGLSLIHIQMCIRDSSYSREALEPIYKDIVQFAECEQLTAHANSIRVRFEDQRGMW